MASGIVLSHFGGGWVNDCCHLRDDIGGAARLLGAATALRASVNSVVDPVDQASHVVFLDSVRAALAPDVFTALWREGQSMTPEQILSAAHST